MIKKRLGSVSIFTIMIIIILLTLSCSSTSTSSTLSQTKQNSNQNTKSTPNSPNVAIIGKEGMTVVQVDMRTRVILVSLEPTNLVKANKIYNVYLYEKGNLRADTTVMWNQPELNVKTNKSVSFPVSMDEYNAYYGVSFSLGRDWYKDIFSVKVYEPIPTPTVENPTITLIYPNGGENWNIGDVINIRWTSTNLDENKFINIFLYTDIEMKNQILLIKNTPNTGNYKWTVNGNPTTHAKIGIIGSGTQFSISSSEFTIRSK